MPKNIKCDNKKQQWVIVVVKVFYSNIRKCWTWSVYNGRGEDKWKTEGKEHVASLCDKRAGNRYWRRQGIGNNANTRPSILYTMESMENGAPTFWKQESLALGWLTLCVCTIFIRISAIWDDQHRNPNSVCTVFRDSTDNCLPIMFNQFWDVIFLLLLDCMTW